MLGKHSLVALILFTLPTFAAQRFDFDGDHKSDIGIYRPSTAQFWWINSSNGVLHSSVFGNPGDIPLAADYDGDGKTDIAIYRPSTATFWWITSSDGVLHSSLFGNPGDIPIVADYDGDGKTDIGIYRPSTATFWWITSSSGVLHSALFGNQGDIPIVADYDGDGKTDVAVYRPSTGTFWWTRSSDGVLASRQFGQTGDIPIVGDFDGDRKDDLAIYRRSTSTFMYIPSAGGQPVNVVLGLPGDIPVLGDFDGDGKTDIAVFRPGSGGSGTDNIFFYIPSSTPSQTVQIGFGNPDDYPLGDETHEPSVSGDNGVNFQLASGAQTVYQSGVPNTDKNGKPRTSWQADSFFPLCLYFGLANETQGGVNYSFSQLQNAGFNCVVPYRGQVLSTVMADAAAYNIQVINEMLVDPTQPPGPQITSFVDTVQFLLNEDSPNILAWYCEEEPTGSPQVQTRFNNFESFKTAIEQVDSVHPVFDLDDNNFSFSWWYTWNSAGDVSSHDNYPYVNTSVATLDSSLGIPRSVGQAVGLNHQQKPLWLTVQAFEEPGSWIMPTPTQLRAEIYAGIIHGATGIIYFAMDNFVTRDGEVIGIAPTPIADYDFCYQLNGTNHCGLVASPQDLQESVQLWSAAASFNQELTQYQSIILSPTSTDSYQIYTAGQSISPYPIRTLLKQKDGVYTLFVVNLDNANLTVKFVLPHRPFALNRVDVDGSLYPLAPSGNSFEDSFGGFEVKIYQFQ
jgi:FG-GAP repeat